MNWKQHHTPVEAHHSCTWKDSITSTTTRKERKRKPSILPLFHKGRSSQPWQVHWGINFSDLFLHRVSFPFFSSLALGCFSVPTERRQALSQLGTDGEITARESRVRGACVKRWGTHTPDRRNSTAGTIQHERKREIGRERKRKKEREGWGHRGYVRRKKKKREVPHWILRRAAIPCFLEAWPCCTATDVDPLNGLLCDKRQWSRNRKQPVEHFITQKMCFFRSSACMDQTLTDIIQECSWFKVNCIDSICGMMSTATNIQQNKYHILQ